MLGLVEGGQGGGGLVTESRNIILHFMSPKLLYCGYSRLTAHETRYNHDSQNGFS